MKVEDQIKKFFKLLKLQGFITISIWSYEQNSLNPPVFMHIASNTKNENKLKKISKNINLKLLKEFSFTQLMVENNFNFCIHFKLYSGKDAFNINKEPKYKLIKIKLNQNKISYKTIQYFIDILYNEGCSKYSKLDIIEYYDKNDNKSKIWKTFDTAIIKTLIRGPRFIKSIYFIPIEIPSVFKSISGLIALNLNKNIRYETLNKVIIPFLQTIVSYKNIEEIENIRLKTSIKTAISAIMSRNASHNIGSHVLSRIATKGVDGWTEGKGVQDIINGLLLREEINEIIDGGQKRIEVGGKVWTSEEIQKKAIETKQAQVEPYAKSIISWSKDVQFLARYIQQRMDFIAQISTEWPDWSEPVYLLKDLLRWFLHQKHLLNFIAASENLGAMLFDEKTGEPLSMRPDVEGNICLHVYMVPQTLWTVASNGGSTDINVRLKNRRNKLVNYCFKEKGEIQCRHAESRKNHTGDSNKETTDLKKKGNPCDDCQCILLEISDGKPPTVNFDLDIPLAIPSGLVGYHAFYVILENIIRNAAKHGFVRYKKDTPHLDIVIEILYDPEEKIHIQNERGGKIDKDKLRSAYLFRIYDNVSLVKGSRWDDGVVLWGENGINKKLGTSIIDNTGKLRKEDWGLSEMKIAAGYLQRREILHIGGEKKKIVGRMKTRKDGKDLDIVMLKQGESSKGAEAIIRAVKSPVGTLGYEFFIPKPRMVGIVCSGKEEEV